MNFTEGLPGNETISFEMIVCCSCKVPFMVTQQHRQKLKDSGDTFYCPNGHAQHYTDTECKRTKAALAKAKQDIDDLEKWNNKLAQDKWALVDKLREARKKDCPHCSKRYINLERHIKKQHPNE